MDQLLVPAKAQLLKQSTCECGPGKQSRLDERTEFSSNEWVHRNKLKALAKKQKIELMNFYNGQLRQVKFTRDGVSHLDANQGRLEAVNIPVLNMERVGQGGSEAPTSKRALAQRLHKMRKCEPG